MNHVNNKRHGALALLEVNHPPLNALSHGVRVGLLAAIEQVQTDAAIRAVVIHGSGGNLAL